MIAAYLGVEDEEVAKVAIKPKKKPRRKTAAAARSAGAGSTAKTASSSAGTGREALPRPKKPTVAELRREAAVSEARLAKLPPDADPLEKANAVGRKPRSIPKARSEGPDDLKRIKGIGPANERKLNELGIWHFDQIARWDRANVRWVAQFLAFPGRIDREDWVRQAHTLAMGRQTAFSRRMSKSGTAKRTVRRKSPARQGGGK